MSTSPALPSNVGQSEVCTSNLDSTHQTGLIFIILASFFSLLAVGGTLVLYIRNVITLARKTRLRAWSALGSDIDTYFLSLLIADIVVALSGLLNIRWVSLHKTVCGGVCTAQGFLEQIGTPAAGLSTLSISAHTFFVIFFRWRPPAKRTQSMVIVGVLWAFIFILALASVASHAHGKFPFYTPTPAWCYISKSHPSWRVGASYLYAWLAAFVVIILYGLLWLQLIGRVSGQIIGWRVQLRFLKTDGRWSGAEIGENSGQRRNENVDETARSRERDALKMLVYPLCYIIIILPISATRWTSFSEHGSHDTVPFGVTAFADVLFKLGGLADVLLFRLTRPNILLFGSSSRFGAAPNMPNHSLGSGSDLSRLSFTSRARLEEDGSAIELNTLGSRRSAGFISIVEGRKSTSSGSGKSQKRRTSPLNDLLGPSFSRNSSNLDPYKQRLLVNYSKPLPPLPINESFDLDLADELELHATSSPVDEDVDVRHGSRRNSITSFTNQPLVEVAASPWRNTFIPIDIEIPSSQFEFQGLWTDMHREEQGGEAETLATHGRMKESRKSISASIMTKSTISAASSQSRNSQTSRKRPLTASDSDDSFQRLLSDLNSVSSVQNEVDVRSLFETRLNTYEVPPLQLRRHRDTAALDFEDQNDSAHLSTSVDGVIIPGHSYDARDTSPPSSIPQQQAEVDPRLRMQRHPRGPRPPTRSRSSSDPYPYPIHGPKRHPQGPRQRPTVNTNVTTRLSFPQSPRSPFARSPLGPIPEHTVLRDLGSSGLGTLEIVKLGGRRRTMPTPSSKKRRSRHASFIDMD